MTTSPSLAVIGAGNIGRAMAQGLVARGVLDPARVTLTCRQLRCLDAVLDEITPALDRNVSESK